MTQGFVLPESHHTVSNDIDIATGSTSTPASPTTSGRDDTLDASTGTPQAIASSTGSPNPSYNEGYTRHRRAPLMSAGRAPSGT